MGNYEMIPAVVTQLDISGTFNEVRDMVIEKNRLYGGSALSPKRIFSKASTIEQLLVRIDDKLSRLASAQLDETEDVELDLIGYLVLLRVARRRALQEKPDTSPR